MVWYFDFGNCLKFVFSSDSAPQVDFPSGQRGQQKILDSSPFHGGVQQNPKICRQQEGVALTEPTAGGHNQSTAIVLSLAPRSLNPCRGPAGSRKVCLRTPLRQLSHAPGLLRTWVWLQRAEPALLPPSLWSASTPATPTGLVHGRQRGGREGRLATCRPRPPTNKPNHRLAGQPGTRRRACVTQLDGPESH